MNIFIFLVIYIYIYIPLYKHNIPHYVPAEVAASSETWHICLWGDSRSFVIQQNWLGKTIYQWSQWIGLRENLQESPIFNGKINGFRLRFSLKPIH